MASKLLIALTVVLVLAHAHVSLTMGLQTRTDPKDAGAQQGTVQPVQAQGGHAAGAGFTEEKGWFASTRPLARPPPLSPNRASTRNR